MNGLNELMEQKLRGALICCWVGRETLSQLSQHWIRHNGEFVASPLYVIEQQ